MGITHGPIPASELSARPPGAVVFSHMENGVGLLQLQFRCTLTEMLILSLSSDELHGLSLELRNIMVST